MGGAISRCDFVGVGDDTRTLHVMMPLLEQSKERALVSWVVYADRVELLGQTCYELRTFGL